jgi:pyruvate formate-lyase activating enzyme-like uncharacterized protein
MFSEGCRLCVMGAKMVLFITGRCDRTCWYCPLSSERKGRDAIYANEHKIASPEDAVRVAERMQALGTGITGGEPLLCIKRVQEYARALKDRFGPSHQIHLYTSRAPGAEDLAALQGLVDEIRMHPPRECWDAIGESPYIRAAQVAREMGFAIGIEVPALPGLEKLIPALSYLDFLNINELEWGETNAGAMRSRDFVLSDNMHNAVEGAEGWAFELRRQEKVHWCSSSFKDSVQLRERLKRVAETTARPFDEITEDGTIVYGVLETTESTREACLQFCGGEFEGDWYEVFPDRIEMAWWLLTESAENLPGKKDVIERYPDQGIVVEVTPL